MFKFVAARKRGASSLTETIMNEGIYIAGIAAVFGLLYAASNIVDQSSIGRNIVSVSQEVREQTRTLASFDDLGGTGADAAVGTAGVKTESIAAMSELPAKTFSDIAVNSNDQTFDIVVSDLSEKLCNKLSVQDLGPKSTVDATACNTGVLTVTYDD